VGYGTITQEVNKYTRIISPTQDYFRPMAHTIPLDNEMNKTRMLRCYLTEIIVQNQSNRWMWIDSPAKAIDGKDELGQKYLRTVLHQSVQ
jgi:hypothetical protein